ncbi:MAG TPA: methylated-DNA--[protein]-cysteine S-methyltransferase [Nitrospiria bacterium]|nr:methylated-DNA--[protein]-cysteine S-methyltransferase [Nitrospiria bacterium]
MQRASGRKTPPSAIITYALYSSPIGTIGLAATPKGLCRLSLNVTGESAFRRKLRREFRRPILRRDHSFRDLAARLQAYLSGKPVRFNTRIDLLEGTPFQQKVWRSLRRIPYGQTRSYRSVAQSIGHPRSSRAVGGACGNNPVAVLIPCHRVIGADGNLGGFTGGLHIKRWLLQSERKKNRCAWMAS